MSSMIVHETLAWVVDGFLLEFDCVYLWTSVRILLMSRPSMFLGSEREAMKASMLLHC